MELPTATRLCLEAAERLGYEGEVLDPEYGYLFEVRGAGRRRRFLGGRSPLNDAVAARLAEDKHYCALLLSRASLRVPRTARCLSPTAPSLARYRDRAGAEPGRGLAERLGYPLVVKPNRLSHGRGVRVVRELAELEAAIEAVWELDAIALVQERARGRDLRLDFLDGAFLAGYERRPLEVVGDGERCLGALAAAVDPRFADRRLLERDARLMAQLGPRTLDWVVPTGERFEADASILNLNGAAVAAVITEVDDALSARCLRAGEALGLRHFGVDLKLPEGAEPVFIEVNASPLLSQLYLLGHRELALSAQERVLRAIFAS